MLPILFSIGKIHIYSYGFFMSLAFVLSFALVFFLAKKEGLNREYLFEKLFLVFLSGLFFGHLSYYILYFNQFNSWYQFFYLWQGMISFGGIIGGGVVFYFLFRKNFWQWADIISLAFLLAMAIGRIGCFLIHDHPGIVGPRWLNIQNDVPVALIELILSFIGFGIFYLLKTTSNSHGKLASGNLFFIVLIYYGLVRILVDYFRIDLTLLNLKIGQWAGVFLALAGIIGIIILNKSQNKAKRQK